MVSNMVTEQELRAGWAIRCLSQSPGADASVPEEDWAVSELVERLSAGLDGQPEMLEGLHGNPLVPTLLRPLLQAHGGWQVGVYSNDSWQLGVMARDGDLVVLGLRDELVFEGAM